jgi:endonuclease YncB( thermonuclease family)
MRFNIYFTTVVFLCAVLATSVVRHCRAEQLRVVKVYNGAEAKLSDGRKIVYSGISVPGKKDKPFFRECLEAHQQLVQDAPIIVLVQPEAQGKELKRIPVVAFSGTLLINAELIRQGYALAGHSDDDFRYRELFLQLQHEAYVAGRGLWAYKDTFSEAYYVGSKAHRQFHRPDCLFAKNLPFKDRVIFRTKDEALAAGQVQDWRCCPLFRVPETDTGQK